jgi:acetyl esterase/lipase
LLILGITTFILYYRLVNKKDGTYRYPVPMWDAQRAIRYVRSNAAHFNINPNHVGVFGFSAGGHLASTIALHSDQNFGLKNTDSLDQINARPMFLGIGYPVISMDPKHSPNSLKHLLHGYSGKERTHLENFLSGQKNVGPNTPPTFIFTSLDDQQISPQNSLLFIKALDSAHIPHEAQVFKHGHHGVGLAENEPEEKVWPKLFGKWLKTMKLI